MTEDIDYIAAKVRSLILEIEKLGYIFNEISEKYLEGYAEDEDINHPIRKLSVCIDSIYNTNYQIMAKLLEENLLDPSFKKELQKLALMDRLRDSNWKN